MKNNELSNTDALQEIFELPKEWAKALFSIEYCLTKQSISKENDDEKKRSKEKWLQKWEKWTVGHFSAKLKDKNFSLVCDDVALQEYLRKLNFETKQRSHAYLVIIEALFFRPYYMLDPMDDTDKEFSKSKLSYRLDINYLSSLSIELNIDKQLLTSFQNRFKKSYMILSGKAQTMLWFGVAAGIAIAISAGTLAPEIALAFSAPGLYGAAAISSGLAALGGGAVAAGGAGMLGGITVLVTTGGILGVAGGAGIGALAAGSPAIAAIIAAKLEVYYKEVLLPILKDPEKARRILRGQESFIRTLNDQLEKSPNITNEDKKVFKALQKAIEVLQRGLDRNRKALLKYNS
jgi:hypothetical protein